MLKYIVRRLALLPVVLLGMSILIFGIMRSIPGDPALALLGPSALPEQIDALNHQLKLDRSLPEQYWAWLSNAVRGDFGESYVSRRPVTEDIEKRLPVTVELVALAMILSITIGVTCGVTSAVQHNTFTDYMIRTINVLALSIPGFWLATLALLLPSLWWGYAPPVGYVAFIDEPLTNLQQFYLPALTLAAASTAIIMRMTRSSVLDVMRSEYVRTARAKGLHEGRVVLRHVLPNALIPVISIIGLQFGTLLGGQVIIEQIFTLPGLGRLLVESVLVSDHAVVQAVVLYLAVVVVLMNVVVDALYTILDPRIE